MSESVSLHSQLVIKGARVHNLKNIDVTIPRDKFVVFTGLSGSGKSSLAFDTIYAEGHRRFVESLSSYARQFLGQLDKPDVDYIGGLSPAVSIDQKTTSKNPRSTIGTITEIYDYLRLLYARVGIPHCPVCGKPIKQQTVDQIIDRIMELPDSTRFYVLAPVIKAKKGTHDKVFEDAKKSGFARVRVDGSIYDLSEKTELDKNKKHTIEILVDRLVRRGDIKSRLTDSVETALKLSGGIVLVAPADGSNSEDSSETDSAPLEELTFSENFACDEHNITMTELEPRMFSFNSPFGACPACSGLGMRQTISVEKIIDFSRSIRDGAIRANGYKSMEDDSWSEVMLESAGKEIGFDLDTPVKDFPDKILQKFLYGTGEIKYRASKGTHSFLFKHEGIMNTINRRYLQTQSEGVKNDIEEYMEEIPCEVCGGKRLKPEIF